MADNNNVYHCDAIASLMLHKRTIYETWLRKVELSGELFSSGANAPVPQANAHMMIQRRATAAGIRTKISAHSFCATGITTYLQNGGKLEVAQQMAGHESTRTTGLYDRRNDAVALDEVERVVY